MKVIAIVEPEKRVLCEMLVIELANLAGKEQSYAEIGVITGDGINKQKAARNVSPEDIVDVTPIFEEARELTQNYGDLKNLLSRVKGSITKYENAVK